jgi:taurine dioxygenase
METTKIGGALGALIDGVRLADATDETFAVVESALYEHGVLFFRDQHLSDAEQLEVAARFGAPSIYPMSKLAGATEPMTSVIEDGPDSPPTTDNWHTDVTWIERPPVIAILCGLEMPAYGGDTMWACAVDGYESLSPAIKGLIDGLEAEHSCWPEFCRTAEEKSGVEGLGEKIRAAYPPVMHPLVRTHPVTGAKAYYEGGKQMKRVEGLSSAEWEPVHTMLRAKFDEPKRQVRWDWNEGDVAIWDERLVVHRGVSDHFPQRRVVRRVTVDGERPA